MRDTDTRSIRTATLDAHSSEFSSVEFRTSLAILVTPGTHPENDRVGEGKGVIEDALWNCPVQSR